MDSTEALDSGRLLEAVEDRPETARGGAARSSVAIYDLPNQSVTVEIDTLSRIHTTLLWFLGAHLIVFVIECAMDELAALAGSDPLLFRMDHLTHRRARYVLAEVGTMSGWVTAGPKGDGRGCGLGMARYKVRGPISQS